MDKVKLWNSFLEKIKNELSPITYDTWFADTKIAYIKDNIVTVSVPMHIHKKMLSESYNELIEEVGVLGCNLGGASLGCIQLSVLRTMTFLGGWNDMCNSYVGHADGILICADILNKSTMLHRGDQSTMWLCTVN